MRELPDATADAYRKAAGGDWTPFPPDPDEGGVWRTAGFGRVSFRSRFDYGSESHIYECDRSKCATHNWNYSCESNNEALQALSVTTVASTATHGTHLTPEQGQVPLCVAPVASQPELPRLDTLDADMVEVVCTFLPPSARDSLAGTCRRICGKVKRNDNVYLILNFAFGANRRQAYSEKQLSPPWFRGQGGETFETFRIHTLLRSITRPLDEWELSVSDTGVATQIVLQYNGRYVVSSYGLKELIFGRLEIHCAGLFRQSTKKEAEGQDQARRPSSRFTFTWAGEPSELIEHLQSIVMNGHYLFTEPLPMPTFPKATRITRKSWLLPFDFSPDTPIPPAPSFEEALLELHATAARSQRREERREERGAERSHYKHDCAHRFDMGLLLRRQPKQENPRPVLTEEHLGCSPCG